MHATGSELTEVEHVRKGHGFVQVRLGALGVLVKKVISGLGLLLGHRQGVLLQVLLDDVLGLLRERSRVVLASVDVRELLRVHQPRGGHVHEGDTVQGHGAVRVAGLADKHDDHAICEGLPQGVVALAKGDGQTPLDVVLCVNKKCSTQIGTTIKRVQNCVPVRAVARVVPT